MLLIEAAAARRKSNAGAFLDVPGANSYNSRLNDGSSDDTVTLRTFSASNKGSLIDHFTARKSLINCFLIRLGIVNRGDSFRRRRSRSSSLIPPTSPMNPHDDRLSSHSVPFDSYLVAMLGSAGVGKCALLSQFRTSECINAYETGRGEIENTF